MIDRRRFAFDCAAAALTVSLVARPLRAQDTALFRQSASALLLQRFPDDDLNWLLADTQAQIIAERWHDSMRPVSPGSLLKPFIAAAWLDQHTNATRENRSPQFLCRGAIDRCWLPAGHGRLALPQALAQSCNAYFLALGSALYTVTARASFVRFGLHPPSLPLSPATMIGLTDAWRETPSGLVRAYAALLVASSLHKYDEVIAGMHLAALEGTARGAALAFGTRDLLAKTGTASCGHTPTAPADGFALLLYPSTAPRLLLLVRQHGHTGAETAHQAGAILRSLELAAS